MQSEIIIKSLTIILAAFLGAGLVGGSLPLFGNLKEKGLHSLLALGTGMLLGTIFLHMLPDAMSDHGYPILVLLGLMTVFIVEKLVFGQSQSGTHSLIGLTAFFGLSIHAFIAGFSFTFLLFGTNIPRTLLVSLIIHKLSETFALSSVFLLAGYSKRKAIKLIIIFSLFTPIAMILGVMLVKTVVADYVEAAAAIATGTFLYVALADLLPEVFHHKKGRWWNLAALLFGIGFIAAIIGTGSHAH